MPRLSKMIPALFASLALATTHCILHPVTGTDALGITTAEEPADLTTESVLAALGTAPADEAGDEGDGSGGDDPGDEGSTATEIIMYALAGQSGAQGGLSGANSNCNASAPSGTTGYAFVSTSTRDLVDLSGVPTSVPVNSDTGNTVSANWAGLFDGDIDMTLAAAGVLGSTADEWMSGSEDNGMYADPGVPGFNYACDDWITGAGGDTAIGRADRTDGQWMDSDDPTGHCNNGHRLLCVAW